MNIRLTPKQQETLEFLKAYIAKNGDSPTMTQLSEGLRLKSLRSVTQRLECLESKGLIKRERFKHRGISILDPFDPTMSPSGTQRIPVIASAGADAMQVYAQEQYDEFLMVDKQLLDLRREIVAIRAIGNSMVDFGLRNNDYALIEVTDNIENGDRVCAIIGEMAVIKKFKRVPGAIILESESQEGGYSPIILREDFGKIFGKVVRIIPTDNKKSDDEFEYIPIDN
ncbi:MAG: transcriptional repressor LexA [Patescibacteria group bacterium]